MGHKYEITKKLNSIMDKVYSSREHYTRKIVCLTKVIDVYEKAKALTRSKNTELVKLGRRILLDLEEKLPKEDCKEIEDGNFDFVVKEDNCVVSDADLLHRISYWIFNNRNMELKG